MFTFSALVSRGLNSRDNDPSPLENLTPNIPFLRNEPIIFKRISGLSFYKSTHYENTGKNLPLQNEPIKAKSTCIHRLVLAEVDRCPISLSPTPADFLTRFNANLRELTFNGNCDGSGICRRQFQSRRLRVGFMEFDADNLADAVFFHGYAVEDVGHAMVRLLCVMITN
jgi:hypothetical protein